MNLYFRFVMTSITVELYRKFLSICIDRYNKTAWLCTGQITIVCPKYVRDGTTICVTGRYKVSHFFWTLYAPICCYFLTDMTSLGYYIHLSNVTVETTLFNQQCTFFVLNFNHCSRIANSFRLSVHRLHSFHANFRILAPLWNFTGVKTLF
jgi:hypothetical protein